MHPGVRAGPLHAVAVVEVARPQRAQQVGQVGPGGQRLGRDLLLTMATGG